MENPTLSLLGTALDFGSTRITALANNLSNVNTPGYKRKDVSFDSLLRSAQSGQTDDLEMQQDTPGHMDFADERGASTPNIITEGGDAMRPDGNNVDVDAEGGRLAAAQIYYQGVAQLVQNQFSGLKIAIGGA